MEKTNSSPNLSVFQKMAGIFFSPRETFEALDQKPDWVAPLVVIILITLIFTMISLPYSLPEQLEKQRAKMEERGMSEEQIDQAMATSERIGKIIAPVSTIFVVPLMLLIFSLFVWFVGNIILGGHTTFIKMFSVYTYTSLIGMLGLLLRLPLIVVRETADVHFSLALLLSPDKSETLLFQILKNFDLFTIWHYAVLAIGFSVIYKFSLKKSGWTMAVLFLLTVLVSTTITRLFA